MAGNGRRTADVHDGLLGDGVFGLMQVGCGADDVTGKLTFAVFEGWEDAGWVVSGGGVYGRIAQAYAGSFCGITDRYKRQG